jgi:hypothetical protein
MLAIMMTRPERHEAAPYYFTYIDQVGDGDVCDLLDQQGDETYGLLGSIGDEQSRHRYAADKWSIREVLGHLNDTERLFVFRALWFARGFDSPLPSFDQHIAVASSGAEQRPWRSLIEEFRSLRASTSSFFRNLPEEAWLRHGIASDNPFTVRALAYIGVGHVTHHVRILKERYL